MINELGIERIKLELPFRLNHVNCFIAEGERGWVVIDAGLHREKTVARWEEVLAGKDVSDIYITHYHPDHFGYAGALQKRTGAHVTMSKTDATIALSAWEQNFLKSFPQNYQLSGIPENIGAQMLANTKSFYPLITPYPTINDYFQEGDTYQIGQYEYEVIFTPGHSDGLITLYNQEKNVLLSTDHILPRITPNISYWFHGDPNPLATYFQSLKKIEKLDVAYVIPSHGDPFEDANKRIQEIRQHHDERLALTREAMKKAHTVYDICNELFPFELTIHEVRFAIGETIAHLEYLRHQGECTREEKDGVWHYTLT